MTDIDSSALQAVVFAGGQGNRMTLLTEHISKPLLTVANLPLFWYSLNLLSRNNIKDVLLITNESCKSSIENYLNNNLLPLLENLCIKVICLTNDIDIDIDQWGTGDVLHYIYPYLKLNKKILLVSGDIVTDLLLNKMLIFHHKNNSLLTALFWDKPISGQNLGTKGHKKHRDFCVLKYDTSQLLFLCDEDDYENEQDFDVKLFQKFPKILFTSKFKDVHLYIVDPIILKILKNDNERRFLSFKADLIPYVLKNQYLNKNKNTTNNIELNKSGLKNSNNYSCFAYRATNEDCSILSQCNTIPTYFEINKVVHKILPIICPALSELTSKIKNCKINNVTVSESVISSKNVKIEEKVTIKRSVIGDNCFLGANVKIDNSVLLYNIEVKSGAVIKNSIVFPNVIIKDKAEITMSIIGKGQEISPKEKICNSVIRFEKEMNLEE